MRAHLKAKTSPTGYIALAENEEGEYELPVARFDDEGYAMILAPDGKLIRAVDHRDFVFTQPMWQASR